ncbi:MAG: RNA polymerase sigma factor RpoH [Alphaproteobacteria bacterium]|nr:RNA polymerase sigma factor RpoH [Alphaproteobacteria bacterium]
MTTAYTLTPVLQERSLSVYLREIAQFPMLDADTEYMLAKRYAQYHDVEAAHTLTTSHLRLAAKIALSYRHYGLPLADLISEANIGLMQAIKKFDPDKGFRLSTYAIWWIKAAISDFILKSWSLVKIGTIATQKRLFYNLNKIKAKLGLYQNTSLDTESVQKIASQLNVSEQEVWDMDQRLHGDTSLNETAFDDNPTEKQALLADTSLNLEDSLIEKQEANLQNSQLKAAIATLSEREQQIVAARFLQENPVTLEELGERFNISRERVRQIEAKAFQKLSKLLKNQ